MGNDPNGAMEGAPQQHAVGAWRRATIIRTTGHNSFALAIDTPDPRAPPCFCEVHCTSVEAAPQQQQGREEGGQQRGLAGEVGGGEAPAPLDAWGRRDFNAALRLLPSGRDAGMVGPGGGVRVEVVLGRYSIPTRAWTHCRVRRVG